MIGTVEGLAQKSVRRGNQTKQFRIESVNICLFVWCIETKTKICEWSHEREYRVPRMVVFSPKNHMKTIGCEQTTQTWEWSILLKVYIFRRYEIVPFNGAQTGDAATDHGIVHGTRRYFGFRRRRGNVIFWGDLRHKAVIRFFRLLETYGLNGFKYEHVIYISQHKGFRNNLFFKQRSQGWNLYSFQYTPQLSCRAIVWSPCRVCVE